MWVGGSFSVFIATSSSSILRTLNLYYMTQHSRAKRFVKVMLASTLTIDQAIIARFASTTKMHRVRDVADMF